MDVGNLTSLTIGCGLFSIVIVVGIFEVAVVTTVAVDDDDDDNDKDDDDDLSTTGLATVTVVTGFDESAITGVPPVTITCRYEDFSSMIYHNK